MATAWCWSFIKRPRPRRSETGSDAANGGGWEERLLNTRYACPQCGTSIGEIEPRTFSFNSPYGACPTATAWAWRTFQTARVTGSSEAASPLDRASPERHAFACALLSRHAAAARGSGGAAWRPGDPRNHGSNRSPTAIDFFRSLKLGADQQQIAKPILAEIVRRLEFLLRVGTEYLTLDRPGRHAQRRRAAAGAAGHRHRLGAGGRAVPARRAVDRAAPARQRPADRRPARPRAGRATRWSSSNTTKR